MFIDLQLSKIPEVWEGNDFSNTCKFKVEYSENETNTHQQILCSLKSSSTTDVTFTTFGSYEMFLIFKNKYYIALKIHANELYTETKLLNI